MKKKQPEIDHIVYATRTLEQTLETLQEKLGVKFAEGGRHPGFGTRNYLLSLGPRCYLEVIGPDEERALVDEPSIFGINALHSPKVATYALRSNAIEREVKQAEEAGLSIGPVFPGERTKPDGTVLKWKLSNPVMMSESGLIPFLIDWGNGPHPCDTLPSSGYLLHAVKLFHPQPQSIERDLLKISIEYEIQRNDHKIIEVFLNGPKGLIKL
jgi:hypothetical protein